MSLYAVWDDAPPTHVTLARIARHLEAGLGIKASQPAPRRGAPVGAQGTDAEVAALAAMPTVPATRYMTSAEYLAQREHLHG